MAEQVPRGGDMGCIARLSGVWQLCGSGAARSEPCAVVAVMCEWSGS